MSKSIFDRNSGLVKMNKDIDDIKDQFRALGMGSVLENPFVMNNQQVQQDDDARTKYMDDSQVFDEGFDKKDYGKLLKRFTSQHSAMKL